MHFSRFFRTFAVEMRKSVLNIIMTVVALAILTGCSGDKAQRLQLLEQLEQQNRSGEAMLNDSLAEELVTYFDRHGDANERMRSRYILGRTYYCLGELPRALELYNEAADCVDTTAADCDFAKLSRVYAQRAVIFQKQIQPRSQLKDLRLAEHFARKGKDTLMAIECFAQQAYAYEFLNILDSVVYITDMASDKFERIGRKDRSVQILYIELLPLINLGNYAKTEKIINLYEKSSGFFDESHDIQEKYNIYYYVKGLYYLGTNKVDSAESMFRKELSQATDLNNRIAGCKGLQEVYNRKGSVDSIAKYASLGYELNDSAYSLSEMQNIQKLQASYDYNHLKYKVEKKELEAERAWLIVALVSIIFIILGLYFGRKYFGLRKIALDYRLRKADITHHLKKLANSNPPQYPTFDDWDKLRALVEHEIPAFRKVLKVDELSLTELEYDICLMIRVHLLPIEISKLKQCSPSHISNIRKRLLLRIFGIEGGSEDFDDEIGKIE